VRIISGGQTGADRGALDAALELGVECGGWCPAGRLAEDGQIPERYALLEMPTFDYAARTMRNVGESDGTLIICCGLPTGGTGETVEFCQQMSKPHLVIDTAAMQMETAIEAATRFVSHNRFNILNVAGPRASQWPAGHEVAHRILSAVLRRLSGHEGGDEYSA
jgi:Circularly permutated YpsA SLOG family